MYEAVIDKILKEMDGVSVSLCRIGKTPPKFSHPHLQTTIEDIENPNRHDIALCDGNEMVPRDIVKILWNKVSYGGFLIIANIPSASKENSIKAFLKSKKQYVFLKRRMLSERKKREDFLCFKVFNPNLRMKAPRKKNDHLKVACVMRKSSEFNERSVNILAASVKKHLNVDHEFVALVNSAQGIDHHYVDRVVPLTENFPHWWCKMELFRSDVFAPDDKILYFDLDTAIMKNIDFFAECDSKFSGLRDFYNMFNFASGVMMWDGVQGYHLFEFKRRLDLADRLLKERQIANEEQRRTNGEPRENAQRGTPANVEQIANLATQNPQALQGIQQ